MTETLKERIDWLRLKGVQQHRQGIDMMAVINELVARLEVARCTADEDRLLEATDLTKVFPHD